MAPEVTKGEVYNEKCDVFSFAIIMMELLIGRINPYHNESNRMLNIEYQVAINENCRPEIPEFLSQDPSKDSFIRMMKQCWKANPEERPMFSDLVTFLQNYLTESRGEKLRSLSKYNKL